uniref:Chromophore lyase CpcS/CpeS n=1 Tax=Sciadococcus taiwanensis TaxID=3028030 RepID=A0A9Y1MXH4_9RHOD|nr:phycobiliprotein lyase [Sciadococcus taiwanensis]
MNLEEYIKQFEGKWFIQRTSYKIDSRISQTNKGEARIVFNNLPYSQNLQLNSSTRYPSILDLHLSYYQKNKMLSSSIILLYPFADRLNSAKIIKFLNRTQLILGHCYFDGNQSIYINFRKNNFWIEDKIWFANQNLKLITTTVRKNSLPYYTSFGSEIKIGDGSY